MKHLLFFLLAFPFLASAQILEKQFVATVQYSGFTQINDSLYRGDLIEFRDVLIEGYQPSGVDSGFICLDGTGRAYRVEVVNSFDYSSLNVDLVELDNYDEIPIGVGIVAERYGSTYQLPNGLVNSLGISSVLQAKILNHNTKIAATTVQPPDTLYLQELSGTSAISDGDTIPLIDYVRVADTTTAFASYLKRPVGWGLSLLTGKYPFVDSSKIASRYYVSTSPTTIANNYIATSNGSNLVARNLFDNNTYVGILNSKPVIFGSQSVAGLPVGVDGYWLDVSNYKWPARYNSTAGAWIYPMQSSLTGGIGTAGRIIYTDANGRATDNANLLFTGTRFQTAGSIRFGRSSHTDTAQIEKVSDVNSKIIRINNPGDVGGWASGLTFRGGFNGTLATVGTFRIYTNSSTIPGSVYIGNVSEGGAQNANGTTNFGVLNKITSTNTYDTGVNLNPGGTSPNNFSAYSLTNGKHFGFFIGGQGGTNQLQSMSDIGYGVYAGFQLHPLTIGYGSSWVFVAKNVASTATEILRLQGKDGNICLGCTNAQYKLYTTSTGAYGIPTGTTGERPTIVTGTTPFRFNSTTGFLEYGVFPSTWNSITLGSVTSVGLSLPSIFSVSGSPVTTSGTLSATFTGGTSSLFLRGDGRWMKSLYFNSSDSVQFNITDPYFGSTALISTKGSSGSFDSRFNIADYGYVNQALAIATEDDARYIFDRSRGTIASPTALLKNDRIGGIYFNAHNGSSYRKTGYIGAVVDSIHSGANPQSKLIFGTSEVNSPETSSYWRFLIESMRNISVVDHVIGASMGVGFGSNITTLEASTIDARFHIKGVGTTTGKTMLLEDSGGADILTVTDNKTIQAHGYGTGAKEAADLSKTQSAYIAGIATDGTLLDYPLSSLNGIYGGSGTLSGNTTVDADGNDFTIENLPRMTLGGTDWEIYADDSETDIYNPEYAEILAGTGAGATFDNATETTTLRGQVNALRESYYEITSTLSPQTFSSSISDNYVNQGGTQASFTFLFPATPADGQILMITWGNAISVVTLDGNGNTITGTAVTTAVAGTRRMFKYYDSSGEWVKIY